MCLSGWTLHPVFWALFGHLISFLIVFPLPLYPLNNSCLEDSAVSDFSLIWFLILSGLDRSALVCYFNLIHQSPLLYRVALLYHVGGKTTAWCSWSPMQSQAGHVCVWSREDYQPPPVPKPGQGLSTEVWCSPELLKRGLCSLSVWCMCVWCNAMITLYIKVILCFLDAGKVHLIPLSPQFCK